MQRRKQPRALTLTLPALSRPVLELNGVEYPIRNFSQGGVGLWMGKSPYRLKAQERLKGNLGVRGCQYPVELEVAHISERGVGLRISHQSSELFEIFQKLLLPSQYAAQLLPHTDTLQLDPKDGFLRQRFIGPGESELLIWSEPEESLIQAVQLRFLGKVIFRRRGGELKSGSLLGSDDSSSGDSSIEWHLETDLDWVYQSAQFLTSVPPPLSGHLLWQFLETGEQVYLSSKKSQRNG